MSPQCFLASDQPPSSPAPVPSLLVVDVVCTRSRWRWWRYRQQCQMPPSWTHLKTHRNSMQSLKHSWHHIATLRNHWNTHDITLQLYAITETLMTTHRNSTQTLKHSRQHTATLLSYKTLTTTHHNYTQSLKHDNTPQLYSVMKHSWQHITTLRNHWNTHDNTPQLYSVMKHSWQHITTLRNHWNTHDNLSQHYSFIPHVRTFRFSQLRCCRSNNLELPSSGHSQ